MLLSDLRTTVHRHRLGLCAGMLVAVTTPARADTFLDTLSYAYNYNTDLVAARARLRATDEQVPQALAGWRPTVILNGSAGYQDFNTTTSSLIPVPFSFKQAPYGGNLQFKQPIYSGGGNTAALAQSGENVRAARADLQSTEQTVLEQAAEAYDDVLRARALLRLDQDLEAELREGHREIEIRMRAGQLTQTDVDQAASRLSAATAQRIGEEGDLQAANARFLAAVGRPPGPQLAPHGLPPGLPVSAEEAARLAQINSPVVRASIYRMRAAEQAVAVAKAKLLPNISLSATLGADQGVTIPTIGTKQASITLNLAVPLYQGGAASSAVRQAKDTALQLKTETQSSIRDAKRDAEVAYATWQATTQKLQEQFTQERLAEIAFDGVRREADVGAKTTFELLGQLQELFNSRASTIQSRYDVASDAYRLLVAIDRFTAADLMLQTPLYDPKLHYDEVKDEGSMLP